MNLIDHDLVEAFYGEVFKLFSSTLRLCFIEDNANLIDHDLILWWGRGETTVVICFVMLSCVDKR